MENDRRCGRTEELPFNEILKTQPDKLYICIHKIQTGDIQAQKPESDCHGEGGEHVYKCMSVDGKSLYYFNEENLQYEDNGDNEPAPETENKGNVKTPSDDNANEPQP